MTRMFAPPTRMDAFKITTISDSHFGRRSWTNDAMNHAGPSLDKLAPVTDLFVHAGDIIHWNVAGDMAAQDASALSWMGTRQSNTGVPWKRIAGNHCLRSYDDPFPGRTGAEWSTTYSQPQMEVFDHDTWLRLLFVTPDQQRYNLVDGGYYPMELSTSQVDWIVARANDAPGRRVFVFFHAPLPSQFPSHMDGSNVMAAIEATPNIIGWVSGHRHTNLKTDLYAFLNFKVQTRLIHHINLPTFGGATGGFTDDRWGQPFISTHISILPEGGVEIRFRDHLREIWLPWNQTGYVTKLLPIGA